MSENKPTTELSWREWIFPVRGHLTDDLTAYDWLKTLAIILMVVDHFGFYFFPEIEMFRVFGRLCAPIFFFLIGYANTRDLPMRWLAATGILLVVNMMYGLPVLPLCILMTMMLIRLAIDPLMNWLKVHPVYLWWVLLLLVFAMIPTDMLVEYGTMGMVIAIAGFAARRQEVVRDAFGARMPEILLAFALGSYGAMSAVIFGFSTFGIMVLAAGIIGLYFVLQNFKPVVSEGSASHPHAGLVRFCGRYTVEIYVIHLIVLKTLWALQHSAKLVAGLIY